MSALVVEHAVFPILKVTPSHMQLASHLSSGPSRPIRSLYYRLFVSKTFTRKPTKSFIRWKLILGDLFFTCYMLFTSLSIVALGYQATPNMFRSVMIRCIALHPRVPSSCRFVS
jgi:hypothetical protein